MKKWLIEVRYEWVREIVVEATDLREAEVEAVLQAKEEMAEQFEENTPSMEEFDLMDLGTPS